MGTYGTGCASAARVVFDDGALTSINGAAAPFVGSYRPEQPLLASGGKAGISANGVWRLNIADIGTFNYNGAIVCWTLGIQETTCTDGGGSCSGDVDIKAVAAPDPVTVNSNLTYTITMNNRRQIAAPGVMLSNVIPANVTLVSASASQGSWTNIKNVLWFDIGTIAYNRSVTATVVVTPRVPDTFLTNVFAVASSAGDADPANNVAVVSTYVANPSPRPVAANAFLTGESIVPPTGGIDPGERVQISFGLKNMGSMATTSLVATLIAGDGVTDPSGSQAYGAIAPLGVETIYRSFEFTALGAQGSPIKATLQLTDGSFTYAPVSFSFTLGGSNSVANTRTVVINNVGPATPYPSIITVSNMVGVVNKVTVSLDRFYHSFPEDVDVMLVGPEGQKVVLMSKAGSHFPVTAPGIGLRFDQDAVNYAPKNTQLTNGTYKPSGYWPELSFTNPAPAAPYDSNLDIFRTTKPNGQWSLYVSDHNLQDGGSIYGGWSIAIITMVPVNTNADMQVSMSGLPSVVVGGSLVTNTITVANKGPNVAHNIFMTNQLPNDVAVVFLANTVGEVTNLNGQIILNVSQMASGENGRVIVVTRPTNSVPHWDRYTAIVRSDELD